MELKFLNYTYDDTIIDLEIRNNSITGITGSEKKSIIELISLTKLGKGQLTIDNEKVTKDNMYDYQKKITLIPAELEDYSFISTVEELMLYTIKSQNLLIRDETKKIKDSLKIVGLDEKYLKRNLITLSSSERKHLQISLSLLSNPDLIILDEPFKSLDTKNEKKIVMLLQRLKEQFKKTIIISSLDSNILYKYTKNMIFIKNGKVFLEGATSEVYLRVDHLKRHKFEIPEIVEFTYLAKKKKNAKIDYHSDIRDIIKDIYKHI